MFTRYGCPRRIISDRGREFCNELSKKLFGYFGVEHCVTAPYHPQANGMLIFIFAFSNLKFCSGCLRILKLESAKYFKHLFQIFCRLDRTIQQYCHKLLESIYRRTERLDRLSSVYSHGIQSWGSCFHW